MSAPAELPQRLERPPAERLAPLEVGRVDEARRDPTTPAAPHGTGALDLLTLGEGPEHREPDRAHQGEPLSTLGRDQVCGRRAFGELCVSAGHAPIVTVGQATGRDMGQVGPTGCPV